MGNRPVSGEVPEIKHLMTARWEINLILHCIIGKNCEKKKKKKIFVTCSSYAVRIYQRTKGSTRKKVMIKVPRELQAEGPDDDQDRPPTTRQRQGFGKDVLDTWECSVRGQMFMLTINIVTPL